MICGKRLLGALIREESGQDLIEYALIAMLIALAAISAVAGLGHVIASKYANITDGI